MQCVISDWETEEQKLENGYWMEEKSKHTLICMYCIITHTHMNTHTSAAWTNENMEPHLMVSAHSSLSFHAFFGSSHILWDSAGWGEIKD